jgi:hypothetical protein|tara:strand:+ start:2988 stop:3440 length:453 start_codon:yes stop_codon:yes gene_type:complete
VYRGFSKKENRSQLFSTNTRLFVCWFDVGGRNMTSVVNDKNSLFAKAETELHELRVSAESDEVLKIWVKEPTWLQVEQALSTVMDMTQDGMNLDLNKMYKFMAEEFIEKTEPQLSTLEILRLSPYIGNQLKDVLPNPFSDMMEVDTKKAN